MAERPILFNTEMVRAILDGRKTQTRWLVKGLPLAEPYFTVEDGKPMMCDVYGWSLEDVARANIEKLHNRYHDRFTVEESVNRVEYREKNVKQRAKYYAKGAGV